MSARAEQEYRELAYRIYISDTLYQKNLGNMIADRYIDILKKQNEPQKTGEEIVAEVVLNGGLIIEE